VTIGELIYRAAARVAPPLLRAAAPFNGKLRRGVRGRAASLPALREWAARERDPARPLVWFHAPSVGEALMAQAILQEVRRGAPDVQAAFTFFSPSAERMADRVGADWSGYLPWDVAPHVKAALDALQPSCIAFVRTEIWPVLGLEAARRGVPVLLVNAVLGAGSSRLRRSARALLGPAYARLDAVGAVTADDGARFDLLGVDARRVHVTGDARFDQVRSRVHALDRDAPLLCALRARTAPLLVAGSTWPEDEANLASALAALRQRGSAWRAVIAPHEPSASHLKALERLLSESGLSHARLPDVQADDLPRVDAFVVDRVGILADLYAAADAAYVGGGFGTAGLHSVVEPAALGVPVLYGPHHGNAEEALRLQQAHGGLVVHSGAELETQLRALHGAPERRGVVGAAARRFVEDHAGGAARNAGLILQQLQRRG
jgi:3-deoxy-D-manno-octulosonic-acid transferase